MEEKFQKALNEFLERAQKLTSYKLTIDPNGKKYIRIWAVRSSSRHAYCFIEKSSGDVLKPASWRAPAKHARGNIFTGPDGVNEFGANYLR